MDAIASNQDVNNLNTVRNKNRYSFKSIFTLKKKVYQTFLHTFLSVFISREEIISFLITV